MVQAVSRGPASSSRTLRPASVRAQAAAARLLPAGGVLIAREDELAEIVVAADLITGPGVTCSPETLSALFVGNLHITSAAERGLVQIAHHHVLDKLVVLFPPQLFWQSQFDTLRL